MTEINLEPHTFHRIFLIPNAHVRCSNSKIRDQDDGDFNASDLTNIREDFIK